MLEGHILRQQVQLFQCRRLVPTNMLMAQSITPHCHYAREWNLKLLACGRDAGQQPWDFFVVGE